MRDLVIEAQKGLFGKTEEQGEALVSGLISGLTMQLALAKEGDFYYDGSLVRGLKTNSRSSALVALSDLGGKWERVLSTGMLVGWKFSKTNESEIYFTQMGVGALFVSQLIVELSKEKTYLHGEVIKIVEARISSLVRDLSVLI